MKNTSNHGEILPAQRNTSNMGNLLSTINQMTQIPDLKANKI